MNHDEQIDHAHIAEEFLHDHQKYLKIFQNNMDFIKESLDRDPQYFVKLSKGQTPQYLIIGCSDSRVPPNEITGLKAGDIFNHRNIANQVIPVDINVNSVIQYAVEHLKVKHIVVMGHSKCGGVRASLEGNSFGGMLDLWLCQLKNIYEKYEDELLEIQDIDNRADKLGELSVLEQVVNVWKNPYIQKAWKKGQKIWVHGWMFKMETGILDEVVSTKGFPFDMIAHSFHFSEIKTTKILQKDEKKNKQHQEELISNKWGLEEILKMQEELSETINSISPNLHTNFKIDLKTEPETTYL